MGNAPLRLGLILMDQSQNSKKNLEHEFNKSGNLIHGGWNWSTMVCQTHVSDNVGIYSVGCASPGPAESFRPDKIESTRSSPPSS